MNGDKFDLNENAKNIIKGKEGRTLNIKNIIKGIVILFAVIAILASFFGAFKSFGKNGSKEEKVEEEPAPTETVEETPKVDPVETEGYTQVISTAIENDTAEVKEPTHKVCKECGSEVLEPDAIFCTNCGKKLDE